MKKKKPIVRGMRPQDIKIPKLLDSFTVEHLMTYPKQQLSKLLKVAEDPKTKKKIAEALDRINNE
ncbi:hypothetical protein N9E91_06755 [Alphaproteobacteria bacterium]|nr:hypothetical protein [Alphaproteobacteria bacterium]